MIDTIVLVLRQNMFMVTDHDRFEPSTKGLYDESYGLGGRSYIACKQNITKTELKGGIYKPNLTVTKRLYEGAYQIMMKVQFSAPKLIYKNNFDELEDNDFDLVASTLREKLKEMGVLVFSKVLSTAPVSVIHYSKNIPLTDGSIPYTYLEEMKKANITHRLDLDDTNFRNEGHILKFHANSFEIALYDKFRDMEKARISDKRAIEENSEIQMSLFDDIQKDRKRRPFELLRMEVRLNQRQKIRQVLRKIGLDIEPTFQNLFKQKIAKRVLLYHLDQIENAYPKLLYFKPKSTKDFIAQFVIDNPGTKIKDPFVAVGFHYALEDIGTRAVRELLKKYPVSSWYSFFKKINSFSYPKTALPIFEPIRNSINEFRPFKLLDFQGKMLNNDKNG